MGAWGPKLYEDDIALDVKNEFKDYLLKGKKSKEITDLMIEKNSDLINDSEEAPIFWFALADTQWNYGMLQPIVKEKAMQYLEEGTDLKRWEEENPKEAKIRAQVLETLKEKLNSPMSKEKKIRKPSVYKCPWKINDVYAYKLDSDLAKEQGVYGRYLIIRKVDETKWDKEGNVYPVVYISITKGTELPQNKEEIQNVEYIIMGIDIALIDERFPIYRTHICSNSNRGIPKSLIYLGNYKEVLPPKEEYIPSDKLYIALIDWKYMEERILKLFQNFKDYYVNGKEKLRAQYRDKNFYHPFKELEFMKESNMRIIAKNYIDCHDVEDDLYKALMEIKENPEKYLEKPSLSRLYAFINKGYYFYKKDNLLEGFIEFVKMKKNITYKFTSDVNYSQIILFYYSNNESDAFFKFYQLLDEFLKRDKNENEILKKFL